MKMGLFFSPGGEKPNVLAVFDRVGEERLNADASFKHMRIRRELVGLMEDFRERHRKLVEPHRDESGNVPQEQQAAITEEFLELLNADAPGLKETFTREELWARDRESGKREMIALSPNDWAALEEYGIVQRPAEPKADAKPKAARKRRKATSKK